MACAATASIGYFQMPVSSSTELFLMLLHLILGISSHPQNNIITGRLPGTVGQSPKLGPPSHLLMMHCGANAATGTEY